MLLSDGDRYVGLVQYVALSATAIATYGISCRVGFGRRAALFGALVLLTTPVVILQGSNALNDLVVASFLAAATYFLLRETRQEFALGGLALALAVGTKFTALIALPLVAVVVLAGQPRRQWPRLALAGVAGVALGDKVFELCLRVLLVDDFIFDVRPIETRDKARRGGKVEAVDDLPAGEFIGGGGERDARDVRKAFGDNGQADIFRAKVVPPLRHAMRLVDRKQSDLRAIEHGKTPRGQ
jgi:hypothetical protein